MRLGERWVGGPGGVGDDGGGYDQDTMNMCGILREYVKMLFENIKNQQLLAAFWCFPFSLQRLSDYAQMCVCCLYKRYP